MSELKGQVMGLCSTAWMVPVELTSTILVLIASFLEIKHNLLIPWAGVDAGSAGGGGGGGGGGGTSRGALFPIAGGGGGGGGGIGTEDGVAGPIGVVGF